jgi:hypothetical protein
MSIASDLRELESVNAELKKINDEIRRLRITCKPLQIQADAANDRIISFCNSRDHPGLKYKGKAIMVETKEAREPKKLLARENDAIRVLAARGIENPEIVYKEMMEARKGEITEKSKLKIKNLSN